MMSVKKSQNLNLLPEDSKTLYKDLSVSARTADMLTSECRPTEAAR
jgi:hypothetical protein